jgi:hypothetical protein
MTTGLLLLLFLSGLGGRAHRRPAAAFSLLARANGRWEDAQGEHVLLEDELFCTIDFFSLLLNMSICRWGTGVLLKMVL